jgi:hypothetical protein
MAEQPVRSIDNATVDMRRNDFIGIQPDDKSLRKSAEIWQRSLLRRTVEI